MDANPNENEKMHKNFIISASGKFSMRSSKDLFIVGISRSSGSSSGNKMCIKCTNNVSEPKAVSERRESQQKRQQIILYIEKFVSLISTSSSSCGLWNEWKNHFQTMLCRAFELFNIWPIFQRKKIRLQSKRARSPKTETNKQTKTKKRGNLI